MDTLKIVITMIVAIIAIVSYGFLFINFLLNHVKNLKQLKIEKFIKDYKKFLVNNNVFESYSDVEKFFTQGSCYLFARIIKEQFPEVKFMINNSLQHCKVRYGNRTFDINGSCSYFLDKTFRKAKDSDIKYMEERFGYIKYPYNMSKKDFEKSFLEDTLKNFNNNTKCSWSYIKVNKDIGISILS